MTNLACRDASPKGDGAYSLRGGFALTAFARLNSKSAKDAERKRERKRNRSLCEGFSEEDNTFVVILRGFSPEESRSVHMTRLNSLKERKRERKRRGVLSAALFGCRALRVEQNDNSGVHSKPRKMSHGVIDICLIPCIIGQIFAGLMNK